MSTITFRLDRDKDGWKNASELTFNLEDWDLRYTQGGIEGRPQSISLVWRICTAIIFLGIAGYAGSWIVSILSNGGLSWHETTKGTSVAVATTVLVAPVDWTVAVYQSKFSRPATTVEQDMESVQRQNEEIYRRMEERREKMDPERRKQLEQREKESRLKRDREKAEEDKVRLRKQQTIDRVFSILMWVTFPILVLFTAAFAWIGIWYGVLEVIRFPFDRLSIAVRQGQELVIERPKLWGKLVVERPLASLMGISYGVRRLRMGGAGQRWSFSYHWVATLQPKRESGMLRVEFFLDSQTTEPDPNQQVPFRVSEFLRRLRELTGCNLYKQL